MNFVLEPLENDNIARLLTNMIFMCELYFEVVKAEVCRSKVIG